MLAVDLAEAVRNIERSVVVDERSVAGAELWAVGDLAAERYLRQEVFLHGIGI